VQIPALFATNAVLIASDGVQARIGSLGAGKEWFKPWRTITGRDDVSKLAELQVMLGGVFEKRRFLDLDLETSPHSFCELYQRYGGIERK
jgi:type I restriction enzyme R subunit